ncbi:hypothetical protein PoB_007171800 [Plakobranchus ocellatus]|uniref:Uncharacterized protein n=1 Tax=Plakobranchus ocellatus TaxID=259542 RepID=A0AAV4DLP7_9GAST|nr:hypothetical protein PoB_007171800 [Plakobranchus ocellatus]
MEERVIEKPKAVRTTASKNVHSVTAQSGHPQLSSELDRDISNSQTPWASSSSLVHMGGSSASTGAQHSSVKTSLASLMGALSMFASVKPSISFR